MEETAANSNMSPGQRDGDRGANAQVGRITIKPPTFCRNNSQLWFRQLESQFALANITSSQTRFHHVMGLRIPDVSSKTLRRTFRHKNLPKRLGGCK